MKGTPRAPAGPARARAGSPAGNTRTPAAKARGAKGHFFTGPATPAAKTAQQTRTAAAHGGARGVAAAKVAAAKVAAAKAAPANTDPANTAPAKPAARSAPSAIEFRLTAGYIALDNLLKLTGTAPSGGAAKALAAEGAVKVDGKIELRKTCKIRAGQLVQTGEMRIRVLAALA